MTDFIREPAFEIGRRLEIRGNSGWFVVLRPAQENDALANFVADLSAVLDQPVRVVRSSGSPFEKLRNDLGESACDSVLTAKAYDFSWQGATLSPCTCPLSRSGIISFCRETRSSHVRPLPNGRGSDKNSRCVNETIRAATVRERLPPR